MAPKSNKGFTQFEQRESADLIVLKQLDGTSQGAGQSRSKLKLHNQRTSTASSASSSTDGQPFINPGKHSLEQSAAQQIFKKADNPQKLEPKALDCSSNLHPGGSATWDSTAAASRKSKLKSQTNIKNVKSQTKKHSVKKDCQQQQQQYYQQNMLTSRDKIACMVSRENAELQQQLKLAEEKQLAFRESLNGLTAYSDTQNKYSKKHQQSQQYTGSLAKHGDFTGSLKSEACDGYNESFKSDEEDDDNGMIYLTMMSSVTQQQQKQKKSEMLGSHALSNTGGGLMYFSQRSTDNLSALKFKQAAQHNDFSGEKAGKDAISAPKQQTLLAKSFEKKPQTNTGKRTVATHSKIAGDPSAGVTAAGSVVSSQFSTRQTSHQHQRPMEQNLRASQLEQQMYSNNYPNKVNLTSRFNECLPAEANEFQMADKPMTQPIAQQQKQLRTLQARKSVDEESLSNNSFDLSVPSTGAGAIHKRLRKSQMVCPATIVATSSYGTLGQEAQNQQQHYFPTENGFMKSMDFNNKGSKKKSVEKVKQSCGPFAAPAGLGDSKHIFSHQKLNRKRSEILFQNLSPYQVISNGGANQNLRTQKIQRQSNLQAGLRGTGSGAEQMRTSTTILAKHKEQSQKKKSLASATGSNAFTCSDGCFKKSDNLHTHNSSSLVRVSEIQKVISNLSSFAMEQPLQSIEHSQYATIAQSKDSKGLSSQQRTRDQNNRLRAHQRKKHMAMALSSSLDEQTSQQIQQQVSPKFGILCTESLLQQATQPIKNSQGNSAAAGQFMQRGIFPSQQLKCQQSPNASSRNAYSGSLAALASASAYSNASASKTEVFDMQGSGQLTASATSMTSRLYHLNQQLAKNTACNKKSSCDLLKSPPSGGFGTSSSQHLKTKSNAKTSIRTKKQQVAENDPQQTAEVSHFRSERLSMAKSIEPQQAQKQMPQNYNYYYPEASDCRKVTEEEDQEQDSRFVEEHPEMEQQYSGGEEGTVIGSKCLSSCKSPQQFKKVLHYNQPKHMYTNFIRVTLSVFKYRRRDKNFMIRILFHVVRFMEIDLLIKLAHTSKKFAKIREVKYIINSQFRVLVIRGLSTYDRVKYWNYRTRFIYYRNKYRNLYGKIITEKKSEYQSDIQKDLDRTFPQLKHFTKGNLGQDQLERLLTAISIYYKKLGYVQGMNFIVGTVMLNFQKEEVCSFSLVLTSLPQDAFWMVISILVNFKLDQLLTFENNRFKVLCYQIDMFVKAYLPSLYDIFVRNTPLMKVSHFVNVQKQNNLSSEFYASQWLFTFFSIDLPFDIVFIAIDLFLLEGYSALIRVCLTLLKLIESELQEMSFDESLVFLKTFGRYLETDLDHFFELSMTFKISKQMLKDLEKFYQMGACGEESLYDVQFDSQHKKWILVTNPVENPATLSQQDLFQQHATAGAIESEPCNAANTTVGAGRGINSIGENRAKFMGDKLSKLEEGSCHLSSKDQSLERVASASKQQLSKSQTREPTGAHHRNFNPIKSLGNGVKNIFKWFNKNQPQKENILIDDYCEEDDRSDEICSSREREQNDIIDEQNLIDNHYGRSMEEMHLKRSLDHFQCKAILVGGSTSSLSIRSSLKNNWISEQKLQPQEQQYQTRSTEFLKESPYIEQPPAPAHMLSQYSNSTKDSKLADKGSTTTAFKPLFKNTTNQIAAKKP